MEDFEKFLPTAAEKKKIPYDQDPIIRSSRRQYSSGSGDKNLGSGLGFWKATVAILVIVVAILAIFAGVSYSRSKTVSSQISGNFADSQYKGHTVTGGTVITATATNIAMRSCVSVEAHGTSSTEAHSYTVGSGVIIDDTENYVTIITNYHVVYSTSTKTFSAYVYILLPDYINVYKDTDMYAKRRILCEVVGGSYTNDIAVIRFARTGTNEELYIASNAMPATIGDSSKLTFASPVFAVGNPNGDGIDVKTGVISKPYMFIRVDVRSNNNAETIGCLQTDTAINGGNSGGGLFDSNGNLIGIVNAKAPDVTTLENTSYAIPINIAYGVAWNIVRHGGTLWTTSMGAIVKLESYTIESTEGVISYLYEMVVESVDTTTAAFAAGVREGDVILKASYFNRAQNKNVTFNVDYPYAWSTMLMYLEEGDTIEVEVSRNGATKTLHVTMGAAKKVA